MTIVQLYENIGYVEQQIVVSADLRVDRKNWAIASIIKCIKMLYLQWKQELMYLKLCVNNCWLWWCDKGIEDCVLMAGYWSIGSAFLVEQSTQYTFQLVVP